jgi:DNA-binding NarL/FixJ family response regulator
MGSVLLVDNDPDVLEAVGDLVTLISREPCVAVRSLAELMRVAARALACELAIVDLNLGPGAPSGVEVLAWLRAQRFAGRVVFLTGHPYDNPLVQHAGRLGQAQVLRKPIELEALSALIRDPAPIAVSPAGRRPAAGSS